MNRNGLTGLELGIGMIQPTSEEGAPPANEGPAGEVACEAMNRYLDEQADTNARTSGGISGTTQPIPLPGDMWRDIE